MDDLLEPLYAGHKPRARWRIGAEAEKFGVFLRDGSPIQFDGPASITTLFRDLVDRHGWSPESETEGGSVVALRRGASSITLEPGGQFELSGAPQETVHQICSELHGHMAELADVSASLGLRWLGLGFHPFARREELPWVPKLRYSIMREYLPTRGSMALDMMQRTCTVQANVDYSDEDDAMRKLRVSLRASPIITAMLANSPWVEGKPTGERSHRARVWLDVDPDRAGMLPFAWSSSAGYRDYVEWALDAPMFLLKRDGQVIDNTEQTFRRFMQDGKNGHHATMADWETHLNTLFPEVRLKRTIELRGVDGQATELTCAMPALWKGLLYDERALERAEALLEKLSYEEVEAVRPAVAEHALRAGLAGRAVADWAGDLLDIAHGGLARLSNLNSNGDDERLHLRRLTSLVAEGKCPADVLVEQVGDDADFRERVLHEARIE
ncbi:MAG: glutamate--cysteine ligase [Polyangiales bacterium]